MSSAGEIRSQQKAHWDGDGGEAWVETQAIMDAMFSKIADRLAATAAEHGARQILDVGCGTGAVSIASAKAVPDAAITGIDISSPMLALARQRAERAGANAHFILADAESHTFERSDHDLLLSRFGVMFFADPVRAFTNLAAASAPGAHMHLYAWRSPADNAFMAAGTRAAAPYLSDMPKREKDAPGQFGFEDDAYVHHILSRAGWQDIAIEAEDVDCRFPAEALDLFLNRLGPLPRLLDANPQADRQKVMAAVKQAYRRFITDGEVRYTAGCWSITAIRP